MKKRYVKEDKPWILISSVIFVLFFTVAVLYSSILYFTVRHNDNAINKQIPKFTYLEKNAIGEILQIQKLNTDILVSSKTKGEIYKAATEISYMLGNDMLYNNYFAKAIYYLNKTDDKESYIYLINNYVGRLYANGCYDSAITTLNRISNEYDLNNCSLNTQAAYFLSYADIEQMTGNTSSYYLNIAKDIISKIPNGSSKLLKQAKYDILISRQYILDNEFDKAKEIMSHYTENDNFGFGINQVYVVCDFKIPYYEIMTKLSMHDKDYESTSYYADLYLHNCTLYEFRSMKLNLLKYIVSNIHKDQPVFDDKYSVLEKAVLQENLKDMTDQYGAFLLFDIESTIDTLSTKDKENRRSFLSIVLGSIVLFLILIGYCGLRIFMNHVNKDTLTQLDNRRKYENIRRLCRQKHIPHCLFILDIDDFKKVNDTYGHIAGDKVLKTISSIIRKYCGRGISAYRYGGEELCVVLLNVSESRSRIIAEEIRQTIDSTTEKFPCHITVSIGLAVSEKGENVFKDADKNLYIAKNNGKNQLV